MLTQLFVHIPVTPCPSFHIIIIIIVIVVVIVVAIVVVVVVVIVVIVIIIIIIITIRITIIITIIIITIINTFIVTIIIIIIIIQLLFSLIIIIIIVIVTVSVIVFLLYLLDSVRAYMGVSGITFESNWITLHWWLAQPRVSCQWFRICDMAHTWYANYWYHIYERVRNPKIMAVYNENSPTDFIWF